MTPKRNRFALDRYTVSALVFLMVTATSAAFVVQHNHTNATPSVKTGIGAAVPSQFSFSGATGWRQGATSRLDMALFHKYDCFVSVQHKVGTIDADKAKIQKTQDGIASDGYTVTPVNTQTLAIQTPAGPQQYELRQSSVTTPVGVDKTEKLKGGQEFGYLQLSSGYLFIEGYCDTADELPATIPALQAIKFDESK